MWRNVARRVMYKGCALKFDQNEDLAKRLTAVKGRIVEANPKDTYFSCGLALTDRTIEDQARWRGDNLLGDILCEIRQVILSK